MKYLKTYENIITDIFKKKKLNVIEPETEYSFLNYVTINDITFNVGDYVKRKILLKILKTLEKINVINYIMVIQILKIFFINGCL